MRINMRNKLLAKNTVASLMFQLTTFICGFIVPRQILKSFGSEVNGLVNSIAQFLSIISFMELGIGAVVQSSLYKPLAEHDAEKISEITASASRFFRRLGLIFVSYVSVLICIYPHIAKQDFGWLYTALLIAAMSISSFAQYYYGIVNNLILSADQKGYIHYTVNIITLILNTLACVILIYFKQSIHIVKLTASIIFLLRPVILRVYVNTHYKINRKIRYVGEPIRQKWNGIAQHVAAVVLDGTDSVVLTVFATLSDVSIYSVYHLVIYGIKQLLLSLTNGLHALIGELWAKQEMKELHKTFGWFEWLMHTVTTFLFGCTGVLILPFIQVYTSNIHDADYIRPLFAILLTLAHAGHCLRVPYNILILAAGHFKQTQSNYIIAAIMNIVISIATVRLWGLVGVAIGTLAAMAYQTVWMALYNSRNLLHWPFKNFCRQIAADLFTILLAMPICIRFSLVASNYVQWVMLAIPVALVWIISALVVNILLYRNRLVELLAQGKKYIFRR